MKKIELQPHQQEAGDKFEHSRSLLAFHGLGSGKTLTAIAAAEKTPGTKLVIGPATLKENFRKELHKFKVSDKKYKIYSYDKFRRNPNQIIDKYKPTLIIADELQRAREENSLTGETLRAARKRVPGFIGLTGTVASNHPSEIASLVNTVTGRPVLGTPEQFNNYFIENKKVYPGFFKRLMGVKPGEVEVARNLENFKKLTKPYIHTFSGDKEYQKHLPTVEREVKRVMMDKKQKKYYNYAFKQLPWWTRQKIKLNLPPSKRESKNLNAFLLSSRQASNSLDAFGVPESSPKIRAVLHDIKKGIKKDKEFKSVIYSNFIDSGINPLARELEHAKIPYARFTGEQKDSERQQIIRDYNKGKVKTLLLSRAGGEGLDLKNTSLLGVLDPNWNPAITNQVMGRAARYNSHASLPLEKRKLKINEYLAEPQLTLGQKIKKFFKPDLHAVGADEYIRNRSLEKQRLNDQFTDALKENK